MRVPATWRWSASPSPFARFGDHFFQLVEFVARHLVLHTEQRRGGARRRSVEEDAHDLAERRLARGLVRHAGRIDETAFGLLAHDEAFVLDPLSTEGSR